MVFPFCASKFISLSATKSSYFNKTFLKQKQDRPQDAFSNLNGTDPHSLLKRRWNDVLDSLNEFEIYLVRDDNHWSIEEAKWL